MHLDADTLAMVRNTLQLVRLAIVAGFVVAGVRVMRSPPDVRRKRINQLLAYVLAVHVAIVIGQNDAWPFAMYPMMAVDSTNRSAVHNGLSFRVVDEAGVEWPVDPLAWSPLYPQSIMGWFEVSYPHATPAQRNDVLRFLLERAERARRHGVRGEHFYGNAALLGPLAAPDTNLYGAATASTNPLRALRVYRVFWIPSEFATKRTLLERRLVCEYRE
jgi:hypothetical protein